LWPSPGVYSGFYFQVSGFPEQALGQGREGRTHPRAAPKRLRLADVDLSRLEVAVAASLLDHQRRIASQGHPRRRCAPQVVEGDVLVELVVAVQ
jgi:hypothetical protein